MFCNMRLEHHLLILSLAFSPLVAQEDFVLRSDADQSIVNVAILGFDGADRVPEFKELARPDAVIRADLSFSGRTRIVDPPSGTWDSAFFVQQGVAAVVTGSVRPTPGGDVEITYRLLDANTRENLEEKVYLGKKNDLRRLSHRFSDDVIFQLFGERGIASTRIAYVRGGEGRKEIWTMDYDGFGSAPWTKNGSINLSPAWDRTGALVWSSYVGKDGAHLWRQEIGQKPGRFLPAVPGMQISASPSPLDGELALAVALDGQTEIFRSFPNSRPVRLTYSPALEVSPTWSPNGYEIAFTSDRTGAPQVYIMDREGSNLRRLTWVGGYNDQAAWSPMGDRIAFARQAGGFQIMTIAPDGSDERWLGVGEQPKWSPDGRHIVFIRRYGTRSDLWVCRADGSSPRQLTFFGDATQPAWSR
jgi:TolB protein